MELKTWISFYFVVEVENATTFAVAPILKFRKPLVEFLVFFWTIVVLPPSINMKLAYRSDNKCIFTPLRPSSCNPFIHLIEQWIVHCVIKVNQVTSIETPKSASSRMPCRIQRTHFAKLFSWDLNSPVATFGLDALSAATR